DAEFDAEIAVGDRWSHTPRQTDILDGLKTRARERGLWNLFRTGPEGAGISTVDYAYLAEEMGRVGIAAEVFNCNAPDTGNMEVLERYGDAAQKARWLEPLLEGRIRSAFLMTEPGVASSDATNIACACVRRSAGEGQRQGEGGGEGEGGEYVLTGEKWWATGAGDPRCAVFIVMVRTGGEDQPAHRRHSMILVPADAPGVETVRPMQLYGMDDAPHGHMHLRLNDVRVPAANMLKGEGAGFEIAQGRLGPGRIHHCMRAIGVAEAGLEALCRRGLERTAFGERLARLGANGDVIAEARIEIEATRLLCLKAAWMMDRGDAKAAAPWISMIKVAAPRMALKVIDEAVQMHGAAGVSQDYPLARAWIGLRALRLADGPDAVHRRQIARAELKSHRWNEGV
ncbi:MAG: acyl-CoA dehydrogenase family protein, partial [Pseudomonadota bacterium]